MTTFADEWCGADDFDHGEPPASGCDRVTFSHVGLLAKAQRVELRLEGAPIDDLGRSIFISFRSCVRCHRYLPRVA